ncbi:MAG: GyrI-like domain-containing protein [Bryobacteraceae bacterium]
MPTATEKVDLYRTHKSEYVTPKEPVLVKIGPAKYLAIEGSGEVSGPLFQAQIGALMGAAWTIKMTRKFAGKGDYKVCALEGQFWNFGSSQATMNWKLQIRVPTFVTATDLKAAVAALNKKGKGAEAENLRLETVKEGQCVQVLHVGPYNQECETIARMEAFAKGNGLAFRGLHHELYLSDPRRVPPQRLRTILRHPVE